MDQNIYEQKASELPFIQCIWRARVFEVGEYDDPAKETWGIGFTRRSDGTMSAEVLGQSFHYSILDSNLGDEYWGVEFYPHVTMRGIDKAEVTGKIVSLDVMDDYFFIGEAMYKIPNFEQLEAFFERLASRGIVQVVKENV